MNRPPLPKASKGGRPYALENKDSERLLTMIVALAAEVSTLHDKFDNLTAVAAKATAFDPAAVEAYLPGPEETAARSARRQAFVERVLRIVYAEAERAAQPGGKSYDEILAMVADTRENA